MTCIQCECTYGCTLTLYQPITHQCVMFSGSLHEAMGIELILGVILQYMVSASFRCFLWERVKSTSVDLQGQYSCISVFVYLSVCFESTKVEVCMIWSDVRVHIYVRIWLMYEYVCTIAAIGLAKTTPQDHFNSMDCQQQLAHVAANTHITPTQGATPTTGIAHRCNSMACVSLCVQLLCRWWTLTVQVLYQCEEFTMWLAL